MEDRKEYFRNYRLKNKNKIRQRIDKWLRENPNKCKEYSRKYKTLHPERVLESREKNKEHKKIQEKIWVENNKLKVKKRIKDWQDKNKMRISNQKKQYGLKNRLYMTARETRWRKANKDRVYSYNLRSLQKQSTPINMSNWSYKMALKSWSDLIKDNYDNKCQICYDPAINTHHILHKSKYPKLALSLNNGIPLCKKCHNEVHGKQLILA